MDADAFKTNLRTVKELILDEHKLVTYTSLSKELCIHVNEAKSLLCQVIQDIRKAEPETDVSVCYMISGLLNNNRGCTTVCSEKEKDTIKDTLKIVFYEHVYCVGRGNKAVDNVALTAINKFEDLPLCRGLIKANSCTKRTSDELGNLKSKVYVPIIEPKTSVHQKVSKDKGKDIFRNGHEDTKKLHGVKSEPNIKSEIPSPKKDKSNNNKTSPRVNGNKTAAKGIAGFFNKVSGDSTKAKNAKVQELEIKVEKDVNIDKDVKDEKDIKTEKDVKVKPTSKENTTTSKAEKNVHNKKSEAKGDNSLTQIKKNAKVDKKRKRLLHVSDSESETEENDPFTNEMDVDHESEDEIPPTPTINTVKITSGIVNPKKRRKIVDKVYTDEDGFILTKKEEVYESCSDNEEDSKENNEQVNDKLSKENSKEVKQVTTEVKQFKTETSPKANKKKKVSPPQKGKQSTINSFFKKA